MFEEQFTKLITDNAAVAALISDRLYPLILPYPAEYPAVTYTKISGKRKLGFAYINYQLSCFAETYKEAQELAMVFKQQFDGYMGMAGTVAIKQITFQNERDLWDPETQVCYVPCDFKIIFKEEG